MSKGVNVFLETDICAMFSLFFSELSVTRLSSGVVKYADIYQKTSIIHDFLFPAHFAVLQLK